MLVLRRHPEIHFAFETHYFDNLRTRFENPATASLNAAEHRVCQDYFLALAHRPFGHGGDPEKGWLDRQTLADTASEGGGTADAYFEAYTRLDARDKPASLFGEKTPRHAFRLDDVFARYPDARVVAMVRDPRAVVASYRDWTYRGGFDFEADPGHEEALLIEHERVARSYHPLMLAMLWRGQANVTFEAAATFGDERVRTVRYEDLVSDPAPEVSRLCDWLGVDYEPSMLEVPMANSSVEAADDATGISPAARDRWRDRLTNTEIALVESIAAGTMDDLGYERVGVAGSLVGRVRAWASLPIAGMRAVLVNRDRLGNPVLAVVRRLAALR